MTAAASAEGEEDVDDVGVFDDIEEDDGENDLGIAEVMRGLEEGITQLQGDLVTEEAALVVEVSQCGEVGEDGEGIDIPAKVESKALLTADEAFVMIQSLEVEFSEVREILQATDGMDVKTRSMLHRKLSQLRARADELESIIDAHEKAMACASGSASVVGRAEGERAAIFKVESSAAAIGEVKKELEHLIEELADLFERLPSDQMRPLSADLACASSNIAAVIRAAALTQVGAKAGRQSKTETARHTDRQEEREEAI